MDRALVCLTLCMLAGCELPTDPPPAQVPEAPDNTRPVVVVGRITDGTQSAGFHGAAVRVDEARAVAGTDEAGRYQIVLPPGFRGQNISVTVLRIGYKRHTQTVVLARDTVHFDFALTADMVQPGCTMGVTVAEVGEKR